MEFDQRYSKRTKYKMILPENSSKYWCWSKSLIAATLSEYMTIDLQFNNMKLTLRKDIGGITVQVKINQIVDSVTVKQVTAMYTEQNHEIVSMSPYWIFREWHVNLSIEKISTSFPVWGSQRLETVSHCFWQEKDGLPLCRVPRGKRPSLRNWFQNDTKLSSASAAEKRPTNNFTLQLLKSIWH